MTAKTAASILLVDDEPAIHRSYSHYLSRAGFRVRSAGCLAEARELLLAHRVDAVLLDLRLPDGDGLEFIPELRKTHPDAPLIVLTAVREIRVAVKAMRLGADNFLTKPVALDDLCEFLRKSLELGRLRRESAVRKRLEQPVRPYFGQSQAARDVLELAQVAARSSAPILINGSTGTGKGILARWIHDHSAASAAAFVEVNCSCLRRDLVASELFGHARGAFTSAMKDHKGLVEIADGGTLFLDEIGDLDLPVQGQLLKVIEERYFRRVGEARVRRSEFRLLCATHRDLAKDVADRRFREDLFYRINVFPIRMPDLVERPDDLPGLTAELLGSLGCREEQVSDEILTTLRGHTWPGNIRELRNVLERALLLAGGAPLGVEHLPGLTATGAASSEEPNALDLESRERQHIEAVLRRSGFDTLRAADALGISRATLYRKLKKHGIRTRRR